MVETRYDTAYVVKALSSTIEGPFLDLERDVKIVLDRRPKKILICASKSDELIHQALVDVFNHIRKNYNCVLMVHDRYIPSVEAESDKLWGRVYRPISATSSCEMQEEPEEPELCQLDMDGVELVIAIGGDGTILKVIKMFPYAIPPIIGLSMGSMAFMAKFNMDQLKETLAGITTEGITVSRRRLLHIEIYDESEELIASRNALNECVIGRAMSNGISMLDVYFNGTYFTTATGDGLLISTPSGSTAYSMSAGGPIVHPAVSSMLFSVVCPHSISYRPVVLPSDSVLDIIIPVDNRSMMRLCVDGNYHCDLKHGCHIKISMSTVVFPMVLPRHSCTGEEWNRSLRERLNWNVRVRQQRLQKMTKVHNIHVEKRFHRVQ